MEEEPGNLQNSEHWPETVDLGVEQGTGGRCRKRPNKREKEGCNTETSVAESLQWPCLKHSYPDTGSLVRVGSMSHPDADKLILLKVTILSCLTPQAGTLSQEQAVL